MVMALKKLLKNIIIYSMVSVLGAGLVFFTASQCIVYLLSVQCPDCWGNISYDTAADGYVTCPKCGKSIDLHG